MSIKSRKDFIRGQGALHGSLKGPARTASLLGMDERPVRVRVMESARVGTVHPLPVRTLTPLGRVGRALARGLPPLVLGVAFIPLPMMHLCGALTVVVVAPAVAFFAWRATVVLGPGEVPCPKCVAPLAVPRGTAGWPARVHCRVCGAMAELVSPDEAA